MNLKTTLFILSMLVSWARSNAQFESFPSPLNIGMDETSLQPFTEGILSLVPGYSFVRIDTSVTMDTRYTFVYKNESGDKLKVIYTLVQERGNEDFKRPNNWHIYSMKIRAQYLTAAQLMNGIFKENRTPEEWHKNISSNIYLYQAGKVAISFGKTFQDKDGYWDIEIRDYKL